MLCTISEIWPCVNGVTLRVPPIGDAFMDCRRCFTVRRIRTNGLGFSTTYTNIATPVVTLTHGDFKPCGIFGGRLWATDGGQFGPPLTRPEVG